MVHCTSTICHDANKLACKNGRESDVGTRGNTPVGYNGLQRAASAGPQEQLLLVFAIIIIVVVVINIIIIIIVVVVVAVNSIVIVIKIFVVIIIFIFSIFVCLRIHTITSVMTNDSNNFDTVETRAFEVTDIRC